MKKIERRFTVVAQSDYKSLKFQLLAATEKEAKKLAKKQGFKVKEVVEIKWTRNGSLFLWKKHKNSNP